MYYHTCPYCGANLDPDERCDCLSRIRGKAPKWNTMDGVRVRNHKRSARARTYLRAFDKMLEMRAARGKLDGSWRAGTTGEDVFRWWLQDHNIVGQMKIEGFDA